jgi:hypothetical protein
MVAFNDRLARKLDGLGLTHEAHNSIVQAARAMHQGVRERYSFGRRVRDPFIIISGGLTPLALFVGSKTTLREVVLKVRDDWLRYSESFTYGNILRAAADRMGLEGIVSKKAAMPY